MDTTTNGKATAVPVETESSPTESKAKTRKISAQSRTGSNAWGEIYQKLVMGLRTFFEERGFQRGVLGLSGGVDSALTLKIAVDALGAQNVTAVLMPELGMSKQENIDHSKILCDFLDVKHYYQPINNFLTDFNIAPWKPEIRARMNTKARIRMALLYSLANTENALVLGTSNLSEILLGYGTKHGDFAADVEVIGDLYKTEVWAIADHIGLPPEIVNKTPSAELSPGQTDEQDLGATYRDLDKILMKLDLGPEACVEHGLSAPLVQAVFRRVEQNRHKSEPAFVLKAR